MASSLCPNITVNFLIWDMALWLPKGFLKYLLPSLPELRSTFFASNMKKLVVTKSCSFLPPSTAVGEDYTDWRLFFLCNHVLLGRAKNAVRRSCLQLPSGPCAQFSFPLIPWIGEWGRELRYLVCHLGSCPLMATLTAWMLSWEGVTVSFPPFDSFLSFIMWSVTAIITGLTLYMALEDRWLWEDHWVWALWRGMMLWT